MNFRRIIGIICIGGAIALFLLSYSISRQVEKGKEKISNAENQVETGKGFLGLIPYSKEINQKILFSRAEQEIQAGQKKVNEYETLARRIMILGVIVLAIGVALALIPWKVKQ